MVDAEDKREAAAARTSMVIEGARTVTEGDKAKPAAEVVQGVEDRGLARGSS